MRRIKSPYIIILSTAAIIAGSHFGGACTTHDTINTHDVDSFCRHFVKAICTKDTAAFFSSVDRDDLTGFFRQKYPAKAKDISPELVAVPFFLRYSPLVIRNQELLALRTKQEFFGTFTAKIAKPYGPSPVGVDIDWKMNIPEEKPEHIYLLLRRDGDSWKVIGCDW